MDERKWSEERKLSSLDPSFANRVLAIIARLRLAGWQPHIVYAGRFVVTQQRLIDKGFSWVVDPLDSPHVFQDDTEGPTALAVDIVDARHWWGSGPKQSETTALVFFGALGLAAVEEGVLWGGTWGTPDWAHLEAV